MKNRAPIPLMAASGQVPVIENSEPNFRKGSEAEIQTETLPRSTGYAIATAASGNQCERTRKLISRWHRDEAQGSAAEMLDARFAKGSGRFTGVRMTLRLRYLTLKLRALCWVLRRLRAPSVNATLRKLR